MPRVRQAHPVLRELRLASTFVALEGVRTISVSFFVNNKLTRIEFD